MDNSAYYEVVGKTVEQLNNIMNVSLSDRIKDLVKKALGRSVRTKDPFFWHAGMLMVGLVSALECLDKDEDAKEISDKIKASLEGHVDLWLKKTGGKETKCSNMRYIENSSVSEKKLSLIFPGSVKKYRRRCLLQESLSFLFLRIFLSKSVPMKRETDF